MRTGSIYKLEEVGYWLLKLSWKGQFDLLEHLETFLTRFGTEASPAHQLKPRRQQQHWREQDRDNREIHLNEGVSDDQHAR